MYLIVSNRGKADISRPEDLTADRLKGAEYVFFPFWSWYIPAEIYENFNCISFHMTDLPYGRGASPLQNLIMRGYKTTMITAFKTVRELDAGPIYLKWGLDLYGTADEIYDRADEIIREKMIPYLSNHHPMILPLIPTPQKGEAVIFEKWKNRNIYDFIRMLDTDYENIGRAYYENTDCIGPSR